MRFWIGFETATNRSGLGGGDGTLARAFGRRHVSNLRSRMEPLAGWRATAWTRSLAGLISRLRWRRGDRLKGRQAQTIAGEPLDWRQLASWLSDRSLTAGAHSELAPMPRAAPPQIIKICRAEPLGASSVLRLSGSASFSLRLDVAKNEPGS